MGHVTLGSFGMFTNFPGVGAYSGKAWETFLTVGARPFGKHSVARQPARAIRRTLASIIASAVVWLPNPLAAQVRLADTEVGAYFGFRFTESSIDQERLGGLVVVPFLGLVDDELRWDVADLSPTDRPDLAGAKGSEG